MSKSTMLKNYLTLPLVLLTLSACGGDEPITPVPHEPIVINDSFKDTVRRQLGFCEYSAARPKHSERNDMVVQLHLRLNEDGSLQDMYVSNPTLRKAKGDPEFKEYLLASINNFKQCLPFYNLPPENYAMWREMRLTFDHGRMLF